MKKYLAVFFGSAAGMSQWQSLDEKTRKERETKGMAAWHEWVTTHKQNITELGSPLGKTKRIDKTGVAEMVNEIGAFTVVQAESHEAAAKIFLNHPHFAIFPGDRIELMECLPIPGQ